MALRCVLRKDSLIFRPLNRSLNVPLCYASSSTSKDNKKVAKSLESVSASLASKGFLRPHKSYEPPTNVAEKIHALCSALQIAATEKTKLTSLEQKFKLLEACFKDFHHSVPNFEVHALQTVGDIIRFYETAVDTTVPFEALKKLDLPENLHIQYDYLRFNPETDTKFNGKTAFPKSSTLVTGLKYRGKYSGHIAKQSWP